MIRERIRIEGARGFRHAELPDGLLERALEWLRTGRVDDGEEIRAGRLYRWRDVAVKLWDARSGFLARLRPSPAIRSARRHERIRPIPSPRPFLALDDRRFGFRRASLLAYEFVEGRHLTELWPGDPEAVAAFPPFLFAMHARGVYHGDLHLGNVLWDGSRWLLLDLDGIRHPLRSLLPRRLVEDQWSRVCFWLRAHCRASDADVRELFDAYADLGGAIRDRDASWRRVLALTARHRIEAGVAAPS